VTVVSFLDEQDIQSIGEQLVALMELDGRRKIVLDFSNVKRLTSERDGKVLRLAKVIGCHGGQLVLCNMNPTIHELYVIRKLDHLFRICETLDEAIDILRGRLGAQLLITCPVQGCPGLAYVRKSLALKDVWLRCPECEARVSLRLPAIPQGGESMAEVFTVRLQTYTRDPGEGKNEYMELHRGAPFTLRVVGPLDLFTSAVFEKLWRSVPSPRRLIIDCSEAWDISGRGADVLTRLVTADGEGKVVVVMKEDMLPSANTFPTGIPIVTDRDKALGTLGELPKEAGHPLTVKVTRP
jgi:anti-anti-sigma factor